MKEYKQSSTTHPFTFLLVSSTDHVSPVTGASPTVTLSKDGAAFASPSGAVTEIGNGWYALAGNATDRATLGSLLLHATATNADPVDDRFFIVPWDPYDANLSLTNLDAAVSTRSTYAGITAGEHTAIASDAQTGLTAQGYTSTRAGYLDTLNGLVAAIWAAATRTLTAFGFTVTTDVSSTVTTNLDAKVSSISSGSGGGGSTGSVG